MRQMSVFGSSQDRPDAPSGWHPAVMTWIAVVAGVGICAAATLLL